MIATLRLNIEIFDKGNVPGIEKQLQVLDATTVDNIDGFWSG